MFNLKLRNFISNTTGENSRTRNNEGTDWSSSCRTSKFKTIDKSSRPSRASLFACLSKLGAYSIAPQTTANLRLVWVGVQAIEQEHPKQTANFHCKQWRLTFDGSVSFGWVKTRPEICGAIEYALGIRLLLKSHKIKLKRYSSDKVDQLASNQESLKHKFCAFGQQVFARRSCRGRIVCVVCAHWARGGVT